MTKLTIVAVLCAAIFFLALTIVEAIPEIPVDIDFKPFFIPVAFVALVPLGKPVLAASLGAMGAEFLRDLLEGYEIDDPLGAVGYVVGFVAASYVIGQEPLNKFRLSAAAVVAGAVHAVIEAASFALFSTASWTVVFYSAVGNTIADGVILGAIPLVFLMPRLYGRLERYIGYAPRGARQWHPPGVTDAGQGHQPQ